MDKASPRAFVCGHPVAHSRSPLIHGFWLDQYGIEGSYRGLDIPPAEFDAFLMGIRDAGYVGGNITIPHKEAAFRLVEDRDEASELIGAVNTVWFEDGRMRATNTDWDGFARNLDEREPSWGEGRRAVVLGAGGSARAVIHALVQKGYCDIRIVNRTVARASELADRFGAKVSAHGVSALGELLSDAQLLVNTTPAGMNGSAALDIDLDALPAEAIVTDLVYVPLRTPLIVAAAARGLRTVDGLGMLLHQAAPGFERWFGHVPAVTEELRRMVIADMDRKR